MSIEELKKIQNRVIKKNTIINTISFIIGIIVISISLSIVFFFIVKNSFFDITLDIFFPLFIIAFESILILIISSIVKSIVNGDDSNTFKKKFKEVFVLSSLKKVFDIISYDIDKGLDMNVIKNAELISLGDRYSSNDYIKGKYKNINFEQSDIHIEEKEEVEDNDGNKTIEWHTIFLGRWMIFDFNKKFKYNVHVYRKNYISYFSGNYKKVSLDDEDFNKNFSVFAENEHDAFYILTPHFMEKIKKVVNDLNCDVSFGFIDNKLHVAIDNYIDSFEYNILKKINEEEIINDIMHDIKIIIDFIDELDLDNDLFKEGI